MKPLVLILFMKALLLGGEHHLILSLLSKHESDTNKFGIKYNEKNYGIGYKYSDYEPDDDWFSTYSILMLKDSYSNNMYSATYAINRTIYNRNKFKSHFGLEFGIASRKLLKDNLEFSRQTIPILFLPSLSLSYGSITAIFVYVPEVKVNNVEISTVLSLMVGIKF